MCEKTLSAREARFVERYRLHGNAAQAAREAGYAAYQANTMGWKVLHRPRIIAALRAAGIEIVVPRRRPGAPRGRYRRKGLTLRQERFVLEYLIDGNATRAAIRAGLPAKNPVKAGSAMLHAREVAQAIARERAASAARLGISADRVKNELAAIGFANIADVAEWGPDGVTLKDKKTLARADQAAIAEFFCEKTVGEKTTTQRTHIRMHAKQRALETLGRHLGLWGRGARTVARLTAGDGEKRDANAILRERLLRIARGGTKAGERDEARGKEGRGEKGGEKNQ